MNLKFKSRPHSLDWIAILQGSRLLTLDVWIEATPDEVGKLKSFNMLKRDFIEVDKPRGILSIVAFALGALATWYSYAGYDAEPLVTLGLGLFTAFCGWSMKVNVGKSYKGKIKVADLLANNPVPFTRDNMAEIHEVAVAVQEQYQVLFGAMFEIEHYQVSREAVWREEVAA